MNSKRVVLGTASLVLASLLAFFLVISCGEVGIIPDTPPDRYILTPLYVNTYNNLDATVHLKLEEYLGWGTSKFFENDFDLGPKQRKLSCFRYSVTNTDLSKTNPSLNSRVWKAGLQESSKLLLEHKVIFFLLEFYQSGEKFHHGRSEYLGNLSLEDMQVELKGITLNTSLDASNYQVFNASHYTVLEVTIDSSASKTSRLALTYQSEPTADLFNCANYGKGS